MQRPLPSPTTINELKQDKNGSMKEEEEISSLCHKIEQVLSLPEQKRKEEDIERIAQWFRGRGSLFHDLNPVSLNGVIRGSKLLRAKADYVIIHQGKQGSCFYVIVRGSCAVYAKKVDARVPEPVPFDVTTARGDKERSRFGLELTVLRTGRCFGEMSVVGRKTQRNASVIADEQTLLVSIDKDVYAKYVSETFAIEIAHRSSYISMHPLFRGWPSTYRNLLSENLHYRCLKFGERLVKQGDSLEKVYFMIDGQVKLTVNPIKHTECFSNLLLLKNKDEENETNDEEEKEECEFHPFKHINTMQRRKLRQKEGFFASELRYRELDVCTVGTQGIVGDIEAIMDLKNYMVTAECIQEISCYEMDKSSFLKIIVKKNPETYEKMRKSVFEKIHYRNSIFEHGLPIFRALLTFFAEPKPKDNRKQMIKSYQNTMAKIKPVTLEFFVEMSKGRTLNNVVQKKQKTFQPTRRTVYEMNQQEVTTAEVTDEKSNKKLLWKSTGKFVGKLGVIHKKTKESKEAGTKNKFSVGDYKELKKKLQVAGKSG